MRRRWIIAAVMLCGCGMLPPAQDPPVGGTHPIVISGNENLIWERAVEVLHSFHFTLARENRLAHVIETEYRTGSNVLEPWHHDSVGLENRLESSLQSIRRKVLVTLSPTGSGVQVSVQAYKELEDLQGVAANSPGGATFQEHTPLQRDLDLVVGQAGLSGWIPLGRDPALEQAILNSLAAACAG